MRNIKKIKGHGWAKGLLIIPNEDIFKLNSQYTNFYILKRIKAENLIEYKCSNIECGINSWLNKEITLELDHINGINTDHRLENLRFLCPNCHSQTETWRGRNSSIKRANISDTEFLKALNETTTIRKALIKLGLSAKGANYKKAYNLLHAHIPQRQRDES